MVGRGGGRTRHVKNYNDFKNRTWAGIDFGTVWSKAAVCHPGGKPVCVPLETSANIIKHECPTVVFVDEDEARSTTGGPGGLVVGDAAVRRGLTNPAMHFERFKLDIGRPGFVPVPGLPERYRWRDFVAVVLAFLKGHAEDAHNRREPIKAAVITIPAVYVQGGGAWRVMEEAARAVGFEEVVLVREPEAAGVFLSQQLRAADGTTVREGDILLVYDLGGGTFDPVFIQKHGDTFKTFPLTTADGLHCGGIFFDERVFEDLRGKCPEAFAGLTSVERDEYGNIPKDKQGQHRRQLRDMLTLRELCVRAKHDLSDAARFSEEEGVAFTTYMLTRDEFEALIGTMLDDTVECCRVLARKWRIEWSAVSRIVLVGGSCRIPLVQEKLRRLCAEQGAGHIELCWRSFKGVDLDPLHAVALGAAAYPFQLPSPGDLVAFGTGAAQAAKWEEAEFYFQRAVAYGSPEAMIWLGRFCYAGYTRRRSYRQALEWFRQAREAGSGEASYWLGLMAFNGQGVRKSNDAAAAYFAEAVDRKFGGAECPLGEMLFWGYGIGRDALRAARLGFTFDPRQVTSVSPFARSYPPGGFSSGIGAHLIARHPRVAR
jgi:hypothetical protein